MSTAAQNKNFWDQKSQIRLAAKNENRLIEL